jgi:hypothetical protein
MPTRQRISNYSFYALPLPQFFPRFFPRKHTAPIFLANSLGSAERRHCRNLLDIRDSSHATHECGHERQFFTANASITAQIVVMPGRHRFSASGFLHHVADQNSGRQFKSDLIEERKRSPGIGDVVFDDDRSAFSEPDTQKKAPAEAGALDPPQFRRNQYLAATGPPQPQLNL